MRSDLPEASYSFNWSRLTPELMRCIAACLHANEVTLSLKLSSAETAAALRDFQAQTLGQPVDMAMPRYPSEPLYHRAQQPCLARKAEERAASNAPAPGGSTPPCFVAHWGVPEPWRKLTRLQHERL